MQMEVLQWERYYWQTRSEREFGLATYGGPAYDYGHSHNRVAQGTGDVAADNDGVTESEPEN